MQYGIERDFTQQTNQQILLDVASSDVVAALIEYSAYNTTRSPKAVSQFEVRDVAWKEGAGTGSLDALLMRQFAAEFEAKTGEVDVLQHSKARSPAHRSTATCFVSFSSRDRRTARCFVNCACTTLWGWLAYTPRLLAGPARRLLTARGVATGCRQDAQGSAAHQGDAHSQ